MTKPDIQTDNSEAQDKQRYFITTVLLSLAICLIVVFVIYISTPETTIAAIKDKFISDESLEKEAKILIQEDLDRITEGKQPKTFSKNFFLSDELGTPFFPEKPKGQIIIKGKVHSIWQKNIRTRNGKWSLGNRSPPKSFVVKCVLIINTVNGPKEKVGLYWIARLRGQWFPFMKAF